MDTRYFQRLFRYDRWANREVLMALQRAKEPPAQVLRWLAHLAGAGHTWLARVNEKTPPLAIWPELTVEQCDHFMTLLGDGWLRYLEALAPTELSSSVAYSNSRGEEFFDDGCGCSDPGIDAWQLPSRPDCRCDAGLRGDACIDGFHYCCKERRAGGIVRIALFREDESIYRWP